MLRKKIQISIVTIPYYLNKRVAVAVLDNEKNDADEKK